MGIPPLTWALDKTPIQGDQFPCLPEAHSLDSEALINFKISLTMQNSLMLEVSSCG